MAKSKKLPVFQSTEEEREFWQTHDAFDVLSEEDWELIEEGETEMSSFYIARVGKEGAQIRIPREVLDRLGIRPGQKVRAWVEDDRLIVEAA